MFVYKLGVFGRGILHPLFSIKIRKKNVHIKHKFLRDTSIHLEF